MDNTKMRMNLKLLRTSYNMTQTEFAEKIGCARSTYALIEEGARDGRIKFWNDLQRTFNIPPNNMYDLMKCGND